MVQRRPYNLPIVHSTFVAVKSTCDAGDTQSGTTCTHTYAGTYQSGGYTCPSGGTLSGTTCTKTYSASYSPGGSGYYCPSGGTLSGTTCTTTSSYPATYGQYCPSGASMSSGNCTTITFSNTRLGCPSGYSILSTGSPNPDSITCYQTVPASMGIHARVVVL